MTHQSENLHRILPEKKDGAISSVIILPEKLEFETQNPNERVFIMLRMHKITNLGWFLSSIIMMLIPIIFLSLVDVGEIELIKDFSFKPVYINLALAFWYVIVFTTSLMKFLSWYFNIYVITNERIIDFDFNPFAYHKISEASLESIVDATQESIGFLPMIFNYGDVYIQTAGEKREFDFNHVPKPAWVRDKIMDLRDLVVKK